MHGGQEGKDVLSAMHGRKERKKESGTWKEAKFKVENVWRGKLASSGCWFSAGAANYDSPNDTS